MALENSIAGSIIPNYALIDKHNLHIVDEAYIRIEHQLMALPGTAVGDITEVASHPMALLQCKDFLPANHISNSLEDADTAEVAHRIANITNSWFGRHCFQKQLLHFTDLKLSHLISIVLPTMPRVLLWSKPHPIAQN